MNSKRTPEHPINKIFLERWSPRAMSGEEVSATELMPLFEAARWAPSSYNNQPWRFVYARKGSESWNKFYNLMVEFNKSWAVNASLLVVVVSKKTFDHNSQPAITHSFDTGAALQNLALQGSMNGMVIHAMEGFDYQKAKAELNIPEGYSIEAMVAIGKKGKKEALPEELKQRESPSGRKRISEFVFESNFKGN